MAHILKNENIEIHVDHPLENYRFSRFDWTGKISIAKFKGVPFSITERTDGPDPDDFGRGFCNEFGIDSALGFDEASMDGWFHKIGVGLLQKNSDEYLFHQKYEIQPAAFNVIAESDKIFISCKSQTAYGYSYVLKKEIELLESGFAIHYHLENTGAKPIVTDEYNHNFMAINQDLMGPNYVLRFPFELHPELFGEAVNPEDKLVVGPNDFRFNGTPSEQFFYSNLSGGKEVKAQWELRNLNHKIGLREEGSFTTDKINLWGWKHVICPELFFKIALDPGRTKQWSRTYTLFSTT